MVYNPNDYYFVKTWESKAEYFLKKRYNEIQKLKNALAKYHSLGSIDHLHNLMQAEQEGRLVVLPCKVGDIVYRICPKCNDKHDGSCNHCAWQGVASSRGCDVYGLWADGQYPAEKCTIVPYRVFWNYFPNMLEMLGKKVFLTCEEAEAALEAQKGGEGNG